MKTVCGTIGVARSNVAERAAGRTPKRRGRPPLPEDGLLADIKAVIADMPSYGYGRVWAVLRRQAIAEGRQPVNRKRVYRVMRVHGLLLRQHAGSHAAMTARLLSHNRTCAGVRTASRSPATMPRKFASPSRSTVATVRPWVMSPPPKGSRARTCATSW